LEKSTAEGFQGTSPHTLKQSCEMKGGHFLTIIRLKVGQNVLWVWETSYMHKVTMYELTVTILKSVENNIWEKKVQNDSSFFTVLLVGRVNKMCA
jgi:plastocyanin